MCMVTSVCMCSSLCAHVCVQMLMSTVIFCHYPSWSLVKGSFTKPGTLSDGCTGWPVSPQSPFISDHPVLRLQTSTVMSSFCMCAGNANLGPYACYASILCTELSPAPRQPTIKKYVEGCVWICMWKYFSLGCIKYEQRITSESR